MKKVKTTAILTCPKCGVEHKEEMPTNSCLHFYKCSSCEETISPKKGDCCVFCSYADTKCPSMQ